MNEKVDKEFDVVQDPLQQLDAGENFLQHYKNELDVINKIKKTAYNEGYKSGFDAAVQTYQTICRD